MPHSARINHGKGPQMAPTATAITSDTPVIVNKGRRGMECRCTWGEFVIYNFDPEYGNDTEDRDKIEKALLSGKVYTGGGGAFAECTVELA